MKFKSSLIKLKLLVDRIEEVFAIIMFSLLAGIIIISVFLRYLFNFSIPWSQDSAIIAFIWVSMIGADIAFRKKRMIKVETVYNYLPKKMRKIASLCICIIVLVFLTFLFKSSIELVQLNSIMSIASMPMISWSSFSLSLVVTTILLFINYLLETVNLFLKIRDN